MPLKCLEILQTIRCYINSDIILLVIFILITVDLIRIRGSVTLDTIRGNGIFLDQQTARETLQADVRFFFFLSFFPLKKLKQYTVFI